jgi:hypothetical protein
MPSLAEFKQMVKDKPEQAMTDYVVHVDQSLDGKPGLDGVIVGNPYGELDVVFEFVAPNIIRMRAPADGETADKRLWYLPWKSRDVAKAVLGEDGAGYFSTSQLNGCRFTIEWTDGSRKQATVLHLAGDFDFKDGSSKREALEETELGPVGDAKLRRRYSIGQSKLPASPKIGKRIVGDETRLYYGGNKASIFGFRDKAGAWQFWAQEMDEKFGRADIGLGKKDLK